MSLGNWGATKNLIEGLLTDPAEENRIGGIAAVFPDSQGVAMFVQACELVATRADLDPSKNVRVRIAINGAGAIVPSTTPALLLGVIGWANATQAANAVVELFNTATPTPGTTDVLASFVIVGGGTAATAKTSSVVYMEPVVFDTALSFQTELNANASKEAGTLSAANGTKVLVVFAN